MPIAWAALNPTALILPRLPLGSSTQSGIPACDRAERAKLSTAPRRIVFRVWHLAAQLRSRLVLALTFIDHLPQQVVAGPGQIFDFVGELRPRRRLYST